jgi:hypothetical protein
VTKPGNSGSEEPTQAEAPETTPAEASTSPNSDSQPTAPHESPTRAAGGPPNSTLLAGTDNSASEAAAAESAQVTEPVAEKATESAAAGEPAGAKITEARSTEPKTSEPKAAEPKAAEPKAAAKARRAKAAEDAEPLMAELEKAPPAPREQELRAQAKRRFEEPPPRTLRFSFYFFTAAGLIWLLSMVASLIYKQDIINNEIKRNQNPEISPEQISSAVNQILWIVTVAALAFTVFLALFGYKATEGTRRARTLVTIFSVMLVLFHLLLNGTQLGILSAMFALVGLALLWSPSARKYFPPRQYP